VPYKAGYPRFSDTAAEVLITVVTQNYRMGILTALSSKGFADLQEFYPGASAAEAAQQVAAVLSASIWRTAEMLSANPINSKPLNTYAGNYGLGVLPLHTDLAHWHIPPRYLMLRCAVGDPNVQTRLLHHEDALRGMPISTIERALFRPRRRLDGRMFLMRLRQHGIFRWDQLFLTPDNAEAREVRAAFVENDMNDRGEVVILDRPGRTVVIDNWQVLHGRGPVAKSSLHRRIERVYFSRGGHD